MFAMKTPMSFSEAFKRKIKYCRHQHQHKLSINTATVALNTTKKTNILFSFSLTLTLSSIIWFRFFHHWALDFSTAPLQKVGLHSWISSTTFSLWTQLWLASCTTCTLFGIVVLKCLVVFPCSLDVFHCSLRLWQMYRTVLAPSHTRLLTVWCRCRLKIF